MTSSPDTSDGTSAPSNQITPFLKSKGAIAFFAVALLLVTLLILGAIQRFVSHRRRRALLWLRGGPGFVPDPAWPTSPRWNGLPAEDDVGPIPKLYDVYAASEASGEVWRDVSMPLSVEELRASVHTGNVQPVGGSGARTPPEPIGSHPSPSPSAMHGLMSRLRYPGRRTPIPQLIPPSISCPLPYQDPSQPPPLSRLRVAAAIAMPARSRQPALYYALGVAEVGVCGASANEFS